jgi:xyloglucan-specific endo-beta-1,4-glucanase
MLRLLPFPKLALCLLVGLLVCGPAAALAQQCTDAQYGQITQGNYFLQNNEWNLSAGPGGWQQICTGSAGNNSWSSQWWWPTGSGGVKAYPSIVSGWQFGAWSPNNNGFPVQVSANAPLPTSVSFYMSGNNQFDAAYDLFFSPNTNPSSPSAELMVWLNYSGNQPAGKPVAHGVALGGVGGTWDVWVGSVGWPVWSFVADSQTTSFSGNLQPFVYYVSRTNDWLNQSWYELNTEFGAEVLQSNGQNGGINVTNFSAAAY